MARDSQGRQLAAVERADLQRLFDVLRREGYQLLGPTVRGGAIIYDELTSLDNLPAGYTDEQRGGVYRLSKRKDQALFGYAVGPHSWKKYLFPPAQRLFRAKRDGTGFQILTENQARPRYAFIGVRACELHALAIQDQVFLGGKYVDPVYQGRREGVFMLAVNCGQAGGTCFCVSMQTGPKAASGFDLALTEILAANRHWFLIEAGTGRGARMLDGIPHRPATAADVAAAEQVVAKTAAQMGRALETAGLKEFLFGNYEHPRWEDVAARCLTCANCTLVCPTCFCSTVEDVTDLTGEHAERWRKWDSCFTADFTHIVGGVVRSSAKSRYRQWLTHKLATWIDQFGTSGCVGCGRCITWCPVGIDLTEEVRILRETETARAATV